MGDGTGTIASPRRQLEGAGGRVSRWWPLPALARPRVRDERESAAESAAAESAFRGDIEGLRAVAVCLVVLFHAGVPWLSGGYVGVDVFFVISGFLITGLLLREWRRTGRIRLASFYARRARRLLPAAALVIVVTVAAAGAMFPPLALPGVSDAAYASSLYVANLWFASQSTQYMTDSEPSPLLHFWSLSVEEQFYLLWPALLLGLCLLAARRRGGRSLWPVAAGLAVIACASFAAGIVMLGPQAHWAYFSLATRGWELAAGGLLALAATTLARIPRFAAGLLGWLGLALIATAALGFNQSTPFPGLAALLPVCGAAAVIAAGCRAGRVSAGPALALDRRVPRFLGSISYPLYLWHWPLLVIPAAYTGRALAAQDRLAAVAAALVLATLTAFAVERPVRRASTLTRGPGRALVLALALTGSGLIAGLAASSGAVEATGSAAPLKPPGLARDDTAPLPEAVPSNLTPSLEGATQDEPVIGHNGCQAPIGTTEPPGCVYGDPAADFTVALLGDSHAAHWFPALFKIAVNRGFRLLPMTGAGCPAVDAAVNSPQLDRPDQECAALRAAELEAIAADPPDLVVISSFQGYDLVEGGGNASWRAALESTLRRLPAQTRAVVLSNTARFEVDPPVCLSHHLDDPAACAVPRADAVETGAALAERRAAAAAGATYIDMNDVICPDSVCRPIAWNLLVYRDRSAHLTATYAASLSRDLAARLTAHHLLPPGPLTDFYSSTL